MNDKKATKWARIFCEATLYECLKEGWITKKDLESRR
jgi:hypothetical protein